MTAVSKAPTKRRQAERSAASTSAMLNAAIELIVEHGAMVSMMAIGQRSGFSHGLVLARFGSKAGLLAAVAREARRRFAKAVAITSTTPSAIAKLHCIVDQFFEPNSSEDKAFLILLGESFGPDPQLREIFTHEDETFRQYIRELLQEAQALGEIGPSVDMDAVAGLLVGMLRGVAVQYLINPSAFDLRAVLTEAHSFVDNLRDTTGARKTRK